MTDRSRDRRLTGVRIAILIATCMLSPWAAGDGVREIHSACINQGCFAGDDPGYPVELSEPGSYRLTSNIEVNQNTTAISIESDDVNLDLNGFAIRGPTTCQGMPVTGCSSTGIGLGIEVQSDRATIGNGAITGIGNACVAMGTTNGHRVQDLTISQCGGNGISITSVGPPDIGSVLVHNVTISQVGNFGADMFGAGYVIDSIMIGNGNAGQTDGFCRGNTYLLNGGGTSCTQVGTNVEA